MDRARSGRMRGYSTLFLLGVVVSWMIGAERAAANELLREDHVVVDSLAELGDGFGTSAAVDGAR